MGMTSYSLPFWPATVRFEAAIALSIVSRKFSKVLVFIAAGEQSGSDEAARTGRPLMIFGSERSINL